MQVRGGKIKCDKCGSDCTYLTGFTMQVRQDSMGDQRVSESVNKFKSKYGQTDFTFCWECTAKAFGIKPIDKGDCCPRDKREETRKVNR